MQSFAKINLYLEITGQRSDGYHLLNSLMVLIDIFDEIEIEKNDDLQLVIKTADDIFLEQNWQQNIIIKAVNLMAAKFNFDPKIKITLNKNIPVAAGLGGGSSNAATVILMLNDFYQLGLSQKELLELGLKIGADVPFFIHSLIHKKPVLVSGIGEVLENFPDHFPDLYLLIINPQKPLSTKAVFELVKKDWEEVLKNKSELSDQNILQLIQNSHNDLQIPAIKIIPEIAEILNVLAQEKNCIFSRMSGSGATCFGVFNNEIDLEQSYQNLQKIFPNFYLQKSKIIG